MGDRPCSVSRAIAAPSLASKSWLSTRLLRGPACHFQTSLYLCGVVHLKFDCYIDGTLTSRLSHACDIPHHITHRPLTNHPASSRPSEAQ
jgi:hypothetical protein